MASCNTFTEVVCANGNINLIFFEGSRQRTIVFKKGTKALNDYCFIVNDLTLDNYTTVDAFYRAVVDSLRLDYRFTVNDNNVSIFYPIAKLQTA